VIQVTAPSLRGCALALIDDYPECTAARGMLRYYETPAEMPWTDCEAAEIVLGDALTLDVYDWKPDAFTLFSSSDKTCALTAILVLY
jgi:hypothetical protein